MERKAIRLQPGGAEQLRELPECPERDAGRFVEGQCLDDVGLGHPLWDGDAELVELEFEAGLAPGVMGPKDRQFPSDEGVQWILDRRRAQIASIIAAALSARPSAPGKAFDRRGESPRQARVRSL